MSLSLDSKKFDEYRDVTLEPYGPHNNLWVADQLHVVAFTRCKAFL